MAGADSGSLGLPLPIIRSVRVCAVIRWREDGRQCSLVFKSNPLAEFVELPYELSELDYNIVICGAIRGALQMLQMSVECQLVRDEVKGSPESEIRLTLKEVSATHNDKYGCGPTRTPLIGGLH